jgi:apolipoprotein N-acyltransferase
MIFFFYESQALIPVMTVAGLIFGTILALPYLLDRLLTPRLCLVSGLLATLVFPLSRVACEYLISLTPFGSLISLAYTQYGNLPLLQIISITGIYGVSFLMAWFASVGNWAWEQHFSWPRIRAITLLYAGTLALVLLGGSIRLAFFSPCAQTVRVAGISIPASLLQQAKQATSHDPAQLRAAFASVDNVLLDLSLREARAGAKIIVWPEVGAVTLAADEPKLIERGQALARQEHIYLEMGAGVFHPPALYHDEAILIDP